MLLPGDLLNFQRPPSLPLSGRQGHGWFSPRNPLPSPGTWSWLLCARCCCPSLCGCRHEPRCERRWQERGGPAQSPPSPPAVRPLYFPLPIWNQQNFDSQPRPPRDRAPSAALLSELPTLQRGQPRAGRPPWAAAQSAGARDFLQ